MTIWTRFSEFVLDSAGNALTGLVEQVRTVFEGDPETRSKVAFSVAMIALSAKMAKADGVVTDDEVKAFQEIFAIPEHEGARVSALYNLAKQDVAGFESYAAQMARLCGGDTPDCPVLYDILDGLFHIAKADGVVHENELAFLQTVASIFGLSQQSFDSVLARHVDGGKSDPWRVLGLERDANHNEARARYLALVREHHPDVLAGRGVPEEFIAIAHNRIAAINSAWAIVEKSFRQ